MHCVSGCPAGRPGNDFVVRHIYTLSNNEDTKIADWVAYSLSEDTMGSGRSRTWRADPLLEDEETLEPDDYDGANEALETDRGHQAPLASLGAVEVIDASTGLEMWQTTNVLSNITAQKSVLNQQPWKNLEEAVRTVASREDVDSVYVVTGPLFERETSKLPEADEPHVIPSGYFKIVMLAEKLEPTYVTPFIMDQETPGDADYCDYQVSVEEIEKRSVLDFFPDLENNPELSSELAGFLGCE